MIVVDNRAVEWKLCLVCLHCGSALEAKQHDIQCMRYEIADDTSTYFHVECPCCMQTIDVTKTVDIPTWVKSNAARRFDDPKWGKP